MSTVPPYQNPHPYAQQPVQPQKSGMGTGVIIAIVLGVLFVVGLICAGVLAALLLPAVSAARDAAGRMQRQNNMKQVGLAIHNYHSAYKGLPHTYTETGGDVVFNWRFGLSPFVEGQAAWSMYVDQPNHTKAGFDSINFPTPMAFQAHGQPDGQTGIFAIVSDEAVFHPEPNKTTRFRDILDGLANTAIAIEFPHRFTKWTSLEDMSPNEAYTTLQSMDDQEVAHLLMGDGAVIAVTSTIDRGLFDALVTRAGKEQIQPLTDF